MGIGDFLDVHQDAARLSRERRKRRKDESMTKPQRIWDEGGLSSRRYGARLNLSIRAVCTMTLNFRGFTNAHSNPLTRKKNQRYERGRTIRYITCPLPM